MPTYDLLICYETCYFFIYNTWNLSNTLSNIIKLLLKSHVMNLRNGFVILLSKNAMFLKWAHYQQNTICVSSLLFSWRHKYYIWNNVSCFWFFLFLIHISFYSKYQHHWKINLQQLYCCNKILKRINISERIIFNSLLKSPALTYLTFSM